MVKGKYPFLIHEDTAAIEKANSKLEIIRQAYTNVIREFNLLDVGQFILSDIDSILADAKEVVRQRCIALIGEAPTVGRFKVKQEVLIDQLELPDTTALLAAVGFLRSQLLFENNTIPLTQAFEVKEGAVFASQAYLKTMLDRYKVYAQDEEQLAAFEYYRKYINAYNDLERYMQSTHNPDGLRHMTRHNLFTTNDQTGAPEFSIQFYQRLITP